jgi:uncharacterized membrane protein YczE
VGLVVIGTGICASVQARLGLAPWDVLHQGISRRTGVPLGTVGIVIGALLMVTWWPLHRRPGAGTVANVVIIGLTIDVLLPQTEPAHQLALRVALMVLGVVLFAIGSGMYLGVEMGAGPRDGLMTGLHHRFGWSIRRARTTVELTVLVLGYLLGGTIGLGTVLFALGIGPLVQVSLAVFDREGRVSRRERAAIGEPGSMPGE